VGDRANHVECTGCGDLFEARDVEQAEETHSLVRTDEHEFTVAVELNVEQLAWLFTQVEGAAKVAADDRTARLATELEAKLRDVWFVR